MKQIGILPAVGAALCCAAVGAMMGYRYGRKTVDEEVQSVKDAFELHESPEIREKAEKAKDKPDLAAYASKTRNYTAYSATEPAAAKAEKLQEAKDEQPTTVIAPDEFGDNDLYDRATLTYYAGNDILADESDKRLTEAELEQTIGREALDHFNEYERDCVYVRNDRHKCYYEVLRDLQKYQGEEDDE